MRGGSRVSPALAPFVEYIKRLYEPHRSLFLHEMRVYSAGLGAAVSREVDGPREVKRQVWRQR